MSRDWNRRAPSGAALLVILLVLSTVTAWCPSNGNTHVFYATTNMGNNIAAFDTMGRYIGNVINVSSFPKDYRVDKLRSMVFGPDGRLYVTSARAAYSKIFALSGNGLFNGSLNSDCSRQYLYTVAEYGPDNPYMDHPYGMLFHPEDQSIFVSNQNSVTVTRYVKVRGGPASSTSVPRWRPAPVSEGIVQGLPADATPPKADSGLFAASGNTRYQLNSVRGIALSPSLSRRYVEGPGSVEGDAHPRAYYLAVCDVTSDAILVFDAASGAFLFSLRVKAPVQVMFPHAIFPTVSDAGRIVSVAEESTIFVYVTSKDGVLYQLPFRVGGDRDIVPLTRDSQQRSLSGITENVGHGVLYVADRAQRKISAFTTPVRSPATLTSHGLAESHVSSEFLGYFHVQLPDQPEFVLLTVVEPQRNIPRCYELSSDGSLRYTALCTAMDLWGFAFVAGILTVAFLYLRNNVREQVLEDDVKNRRKSQIISEGNDDEPIGSKPNSKLLQGYRSDSVAH